ncbi:MAG: TetR/AcrR family transcriptional regulator [Myxococcales bacterium]|nr:TetR/AcrR family transcriptional regulator [Myxococcales bacterium]
MVSGAESSERGSIPPTRDTRDFPQQRARDTRQRLLEAAELAFTQRGYDETQTPDIAERAGVAVGTFYRYFSDKRQAFVELVEQHLERSYQSVMNRLTPDSFASTRTTRERRAAVDQVIDILFESTSVNPRLSREFMAVAMRDAEIAKLRDDYEERGRVVLAALIRQSVSEARIPDAAAAAHVISVAAQDVAFVTVGLRGPPPSPRQARAMRAALADMLYRYAFGED